MRERDAKDSKTLRCTITGATYPKPSDSSKANTTNTYHAVHILAAAPSKRTLKAGAPIPQQLIDRGYVLPMCVRKMTPDEQKAAAASNPDSATHLTHVLLQRCTVPLPPGIEQDEDGYSYDSKLAIWADAHFNLPFENGSIWFDDTKTLCGLPSDSLSLPQVRVVLDAKRKLLEPKTATVTVPFVDPAVLMLQRLIAPALRFEPAASPRPHSPAALKRLGAAHAAIALFDCAGESEVGPPLLVTA